MNIFVIHGPNLNMLGKRPKNHYGSLTLEDLYQEITLKFPNDDFTFFQSNHEGEIIDVIHQLLTQDYDAVLVNLGAYTHTSIAIRDALEILTIPIVDVHLSNIEEREDFRKINYLKGIAKAHFMGKQIESYFEAINFLTKNIV